MLLKMNGTDAASIRDPARDRRKSAKFVAQNRSQATHSIGNDVNNPAAAQTNAPTCAAERSREDSAKKHFVAKGPMIMLRSKRPRRTLSSDITRSLSRARAW